MAEGNISSVRLSTPREQVCLTRGVLLAVRMTTVQELRALAADMPFYDPLGRRLNDWTLEAVTLTGTREP